MGFPNRCVAILVAYIIHWVLALGQSSGALGACWTHPEFDGADGVLSLLQLSSNIPTNVKKTLPNPMIAAFLVDAAPSAVLADVEAGVNVIFWGVMYFNYTMLNPHYVQSVVDVLMAQNQEVVHILALNAWDLNVSDMPGQCRHAMPNCSGRDRANDFRSWNVAFAKQGGGIWKGFDGIAWLEMLNWTTPIPDEVSQEYLHIMYEMSFDLHDDFIISIVPPKSYFNCHTSGFDLLTHHPALQNPEYGDLALNLFAPLYARNPAVFDLVVIQLYETWGETSFQLYWSGDPNNVKKIGWPRTASLDRMTNIVDNNVRCLIDGSWNVDFNGFFGLSNGTLIQLPPYKVAMALALDTKGSTGATARGTYFPPFGSAYFDAASIAQECHCARGVVYWELGLDDAEHSFVSELVRNMHRARSCPYLSAT